MLGVSYDVRFSEFTLVPMSDLQPSWLCASILHRWRSQLAVAGVVEPHPGGESPIDFVVVRAQGARHIASLSGQVVRIGHRLPSTTPATTHDAGQARANGTTSPENPRWDALHQSPPGYPCCIRSDVVMEHAPRTLVTARLHVGDAYDLAVSEPPPAIGPHGLTRPHAYSV